MVHTLTGKDLTIDELAGIVRGERVALSSAALGRVRRSKKFLDAEARSRIIYGVNTGFGPMASVLVGTDDLAALQRNLVRSHACGAGEPVKDEQVLAAMAVRLNTLLRGDSGVSVELLQLLAKLINARFAPLIPEHGGVGASGDLIQLSHIALGLIGEGDATLRGKRMGASEALHKLNLKPRVLQQKEGLALINGTSFMAGAAALAAYEARHILSVAIRSSALALEAAGAFDDALAPYLHDARPHPGQGEIAKLLRALTAGSKLLQSRRAFERSQKPQMQTVELERKAQDVYSLRCAPQILGPMLETLRDVESTITIEMNSATDNPLIDERGGEVLHGGNFHGEYVAAAMDRLKLAFAKLSVLCERRLNFFLHDKVNGAFPPFLNLETPGLTLGLQGLQFVATSTTALNQSLAYPHSLHSLPSNADNQDVVSMGADAALLAARVVENTALVAAIELAALSQAFATLKSRSNASPEGKNLVRAIRNNLPVVREDRPLWRDLQTLATAVRHGEMGKNLL
ncbi:MAG: aromatic amino acid lyase [Patescibacteria group bacterium]|nr:aromatic amino acid lyase [Patescibacteria group bacterium]